MVPTCGRRVGTVITAISYAHGGPDELYVAGGGVVFQLHGVRGAAGIQLYGEAGANRGCLCCRRQRLPRGLYFLDSTVKALAQASVL